MSRTSCAADGISKLRRRTILTIAAVLFGAGVTFAASDDLGRCLSAEVPEPVVMPDGKVFSAEKLKLMICYRVAYSPVMGLQEISIDGEGLGMYMTRSSQGPISEGSLAEDPRVAHRPYLIFMRNSRNELELHSYHRTVGDSVQHHVFASGENPRVTSHWTTSASNRDSSEKPKQRRRNKRGFDLEAVMQQENAVILFAAAR